MLGSTTSPCPAKLVHEDSRSVPARRRASVEEHFRRWPVGNLTRTDARIRDRALDPEGVRPRPPLTGLRGVCQDSRLWLSRSRLRLNGAADVVDDGAPDSSHVDHSPPALAPRLALALSWQMDRRWEQVNGRRI